MGCFLISFCLGNSILPLRDCLAHHMKPHRYFFLTDPFFFPVFSYIIVDHIYILFLSLKNTVPEVSFCSDTLFLPPVCKESYALLAH